MYDRCTKRAPRTGLRTAALLPVAVVAWLTMGAGTAMAAPSAHAATTATAANSGTTTPDKASGKSDHSAGNAGTSGDASQQQPISNADQNSGGANGKCPGGPYCSTRDGSPSGNGNGNGQATGKPCAGCVGKADNKNPQGQYPNGSDHNAGYECDRNHGIGRSNPAHTGCTSTPPPCDSTTTDCGSGGGCDTATEDCGSGGGCDTATEDCGSGGGCDSTVEDCGSGGGCDSTVEDCGSGGGCDSTVEDCGSGGCDAATTDCTGGGCTAGATDCTPGSDCVPTADNGFCSTVEGEHQTRTPNTPPTNVLGEKVTRTPSALPFTGVQGIGLLLGTAALVMTVGGGLMIASRRRRGEVG